MTGKVRLRVFGCGLLLAAGAVAQVPTLPNRPQAAGAETPAVGAPAGAGRATVPGSFLLPQGATGGEGVGPEDP